MRPAGGRQIAREKLANSLALCFTAPFLCIREDPLYNIRFPSNAPRRQCARNYCPLMSPPLCDDAIVEKTAPPRIGGRKSERRRGAKGAACIRSTNFY